MYAVGVLHQLRVLVMFPDYGLHVETYCVLCRYGTGQRALLSYDPHCSVDIKSSGESSSGFTSQESTMERCKTGTLTPKTTAATFCIIGPILRYDCITCFSLPSLGLRSGDVVNICHLWACERPLRFFGNLGLYK